MGVLPGHYAPVDDPKSVYACRMGYQCPGGLTAACSNGFDSNVLACSKCQSGFFDDGAGCIACDGGKSFLPALFAMAGVALLAIAFKVCNSPHAALTAPLLFTCIALGMVLMATQSLAVMNDVFSFDLEPMKSMMGITTVVRFDVSMWRMDCLVDTTTKSVFISKNLVPLLVLAVYIGFYAIAHTYATITDNVEYSSFGSYIVLYFKNQSFQ